MQISLFWAEELIKCFIGSSGSERLAVIYSPFYEHSCAFISQVVISAAEFASFQKWNVAWMINILGKPLLPIFQKLCTNLGIYERSWRPQLAGTWCTGRTPRVHSHSIHPIHQSRHVDCRPTDGFCAKFILYRVFSRVSWADSLAVRQVPGHQLWAEWWE